MRRVAFLLALGSSLACSKATPKPKSWVSPLLGIESFSTIARVEASCDQRFAPVNHGRVNEPEQFARFSVEQQSVMQSYECTMSNWTAYNITFTLGDVSFMRITGSSPAERLAIFDRVFAGLVPERVREPMRQSISDPAHFRYQAGNAQLDLENTDTRISWSVRPILPPAKG